MKKKEKKKYVILAFFSIIFGMPFHAIGTPMGGKEESGSAGSCGPFIEVAIATGPNCGILVSGKLI